MLHYIIRDHDREKFEQKKQRFERVDGLSSTREYGEGTVTLIAARHLLQHERGHPAPTRSACSIWR